MLYGKAKSVKLAQRGDEIEVYDVCDFSAADRTPEEFAEILSNAESFKPIEETVSVIRNDNDESELIEEFREAVKSKVGGFEKDRAALFLLKLCPSFHTSKIQNWILNPSCRGSNSPQGLGLIGQKLSFYYLFFNIYISYLF